MFSTQFKHFTYGNVTALAKIVLILWIRTGLIVR